MRPRRRWHGARRGQPGGQFQRGGGRNIVDLVELKGRLGIEPRQDPVEPLRMGFHSTSIAIIDVLRYAPLESAGTLPKRLALLFEQAHLFVLPPRREDRAFPRVVKHRPAKYPRKKYQSVA